MSDNTLTNTLSLSQAPMRIADLLPKIQAVLQQESWDLDGTFDGSDNEVSSMTLDEEVFKENRVAEIPHDATSTEVSLIANKTDNQFSYSNSTCGMQTVNKDLSSEEKRIPLQDKNRSNVNSTQKSSVPWYKRPQSSKKPIQPINFPNKVEVTTPSHVVRQVTTPSHVVRQVTTPSYVIKQGTTPLHVARRNFSLRTPILFGSSREEPAKVTSFKHTLLPVEEQDSPQADTFDSVPQGTSTPLKPAHQPPTVSKIIPSSHTSSPPSEILPLAKYTSPTLTAPSVSACTDITPLNLSTKPTIPDNADSISKNAHARSNYSQSVSLKFLHSAQSETTPSTFRAPKNIARPEENIPASSHINPIVPDSAILKPSRSNSHLPVNHGSNANLSTAKVDNQVSPTSQEVKQDLFKIPQGTSELSRFKTLTVNGKPYTVLAKIGIGGSSEVFKVLDPTDSSIYAVKCVNLAVDSSLAEGYINEIRLLKKLQGSERVVIMHDFEFVPKTKMLCTVMELGDTDLSKVLKSYTAHKTLPGPLVVAYWTEMLSAVEYIHANGIIHADLKPANFLLVRGRIKLIDFGIASAIAGDATSIVKETATGTFNYISPEALFAQQDSQQIKISTLADVWSLGCILYSLVYGKTPFSHITNVYQKMAAIINSELPIEFPKVSHIPPVVIYALRRCLTRDSKKRPSVKELIDLPYMGCTECRLSFDK